MSLGGGPVQPSQPHVLTRMFNEKRVPLTVLRYANGHPTFLVLLDTRRFTVQHFLLNTFFPDDQLAIRQSLGADELTAGRAASGSVRQLALESLDFLSNVFAASGS